MTFDAQMDMDTFFGLIALFVFCLVVIAFGILDQRNEARQRKTIEALREVYQKLDSIDRRIEDHSKTISMLMYSIYRYRATAPPVYT